MKCLRQVTYLPEALGRRETWNGTITGLTPNTTYNVRAYATILGDTVYGGVQQVTTLPGPPVVTTQAVDNVQFHTATGHGTVTSDSGATITERGVVFSLVANPTTVYFAEYGPDPSTNTSVSYIEKRPLAVYARLTGGLA